MASENPAASTMGRSLPGAEGESSFETPRKRQKKGSKYQAFEQAEKDLLKKYETWESQSRRILNRTYDKLFEDLSHSNVREEINYLKRRLTSLKKKTSLDPIYIGFLGRIGAGKTSLLNAILGKELFLPVSGSSICTSCVVQVNTSRADQFEAMIHLLTDDEWKEELKNLVEILRKNGDSEQDDDDCNECVNDAIEKLHALYGEGAEGKDYEALLTTEMQVTIPKRRIIAIKEQEAEELSRKLDAYIRVRDESTDRLWPLIKFVEVTIPGSEIIPEGINFLDIPGTGDFNSKRDEMWKQSINTCSVIWIISDIERVQGEKIQAKLLEESIKAFRAGTCTDIAMVITKSDKMHIQEYRRERKNKNYSVENEHDAILERNQDVKTKKAVYLNRKLREKLPSDSEVINKPKLIYTVSAREFWNPNHLSKEETEIPELREYLRMIYLKEKQKLVKDYVAEIWGIHRLAKNFGSMLQHEDQVFQKSGVKELILKDIDSLENPLEKCFDDIRQPLRESVKDARNNYEDTVIRLLTKDEYRGYHRTLKAVCLKDGVYASRIFARIDFNESLAKPMYDKIDGVFECIFRTQNATRASLWPHLEMFQIEVQSKILQTGKDNCLPNDNSKIQNFILETNIILQKLRKTIFHKKLCIYQSLCVSIQNKLKPYYKAASETRGHGSCGRMKKILMEGIAKEVQNQMFEMARSKMMIQFLELKREILEELKKNISTVFNLVFLQQERAAVHLADIENECRDIHEIYIKLQNDH